MADIKAISKNAKSNVKEETRKHKILESDLSIEDYREINLGKFKTRITNLRSYQGNTKCKRRNKLESKKRK